MPTQHSRAQVEGLALQERLGTLLRQREGERERGRQAAEVWSGVERPEMTDLATDPRERAGELADRFRAALLAHCDGAAPNNAVDTDAQPALHRVLPYLRESFEERFAFGVDSILSRLVT